MSAASSAPWRISSPDRRDGYARTKRKARDEPVSRKRTREAEVYSDSEGDPEPDEDAAEEDAREAEEEPQKEEEEEGETPATLCSPAPYDDE